MMNKEKIIALHGRVSSLTLLDAEMFAEYLAVCRDEWLEALGGKFLNAYSGPTKAVWVFPTLKEEG